MTAPRNTPRGVECVDCKKERERRGLPYPANPRPAVYGGPNSPRCATHDRLKRKASKVGAHERRVPREYGLAPGEYGELYLHQKGVCAICTRATGATRNLSVDHDHRSGRVRGLLCRPCNDLLGHLRDDADAVLRIYTYLRNPPADQLGIVAVHREKRES